MQFGNTGNVPPAPMGAPAPMTGGNPVINLSKGQKISLTKEAPALNNIMVGLGWNVKMFDGGADFDLDASVFLVKADNTTDNNGFIFYKNLIGPNDCVVHQGDNRVGQDDGDAEKILVSLDKIPSNIDKVAVVVTIYEADVRHQNFGMVKKAFIRLVNNDTGDEVIRFDLGEDFSSETGIVVAEFYRHSGEWKFNAVASGFAGGLPALCRNYGLDVEGG